MDPLILRGIILAVQAAVEFARTQGIKEEDIKQAVADRLESLKKKDPNYLPDVKGGE